MQTNDEYLLFNECVLFLCFEIPYLKLVFNRYCVFVLYLNVFPWIWFNGLLCLTTSMLDHLIVVQVSLVKESKDEGQVRLTNVKLVWFRVEILLGHKVFDEILQLLNEPSLAN